VRAGERRPSISPRTPSATSGASSFHRSSSSWHRSSSSCCASSSCATKCGARLWSSSCRQPFARQSCESRACDGSRAWRSSSASHVSASRPCASSGDAPGAPRTSDRMACPCRSPPCRAAHPWVASASRRSLARTSPNHLSQIFNDHHAGVVWHIAFPTLAQVRRFFVTSDQTHEYLV